MKDIFVVGVGHPRNGTGFATAVLNNSGLDIGHETIKENGMVSWMACVNKEEKPFSNEVIRDYELEKAKIFRVARSPLDSMVSVMVHNYYQSGFNFQAQMINKYKGANILDSEFFPASPLGHAITCQYYWNELCDEMNPEVVYRVDHPEDDKVLSEFLGMKISRKGVSSDVNSKSWLNQSFAFELDHLAVVDDEWKLRLANLCSRLGYEDDANRIVEKFKL